MTHDPANDNQSAYNPVMDDVLNLLVIIATMTTAEVVEMCDRSKVRARDILGLKVARQEVATVFRVLGEMGKVHPQS